VAFDLHDRGPDHFDRADHGLRIGVEEIVVVWLGITSRL